MQRGHGWENAAAFLATPHVWSFSIRRFSSCCCWKPGEEVRGELLLWGHQWKECARSLLGSLSLSAPTTQRGLGVLMIPRVWLPSWGYIHRLPARAGCSLRGGQTFWGGPEAWPFPTRTVGDVAAPAPWWDAQQGGSDPRVSPHHRGLLLSPRFGGHGKPHRRGGDTSSRAHHVPLSIPPSPPAPPGRGGDAVTYIRDKEGPQPAATAAGP